MKERLTRAAQYDGITITSPREIPSHTFLEVHEFQQIHQIQPSKRYPLHVDCPSNRTHTRPDKSSLLFVHRSGVDVEFEIFAGRVHHKLEVFQFPWELLFGS